MFHVWTSRHWGISAGSSNGASGEAFFCAFRIWKRSKPRAAALDLWLIGKRQVQWQRQFHERPIYAMSDAHEMAGTNKSKTYARNYGHTTFLTCQHPPLGQGLNGALSFSPSWGPAGIILGWLRQWYFITSGHAQSTSQLLKAFHKLHFMYVSRQPF